MRGSLMAEQSTVTRKVWVRVPPPQSFVLTESPRPVILNMSDSQLGPRETGAFCFTMEIIRPGADRFRRVAFLYTEGTKCPPQSYIY